MAKVLISMPDKFLNDIDTLANNESRSRSELIREALRSYINKTNIINNAKAATNAELLEALLS